MQAFMSSGCDPHQLHSAASLPNCWVGQALMSGHGNMPMGGGPPKPESKPCKSYPPAGATNNRAGGKSCSEALMRFAKQSELQGQQQKSLQALTSAISTLQQSPQAALASLVSGGAPALQGQQHGWACDLSSLDSLSSMDPSVMLLQQSLASQMSLGQFQSMAGPGLGLQQLGQHTAGMAPENALLAAALSAPLQGVPMQNVHRGMPPQVLFGSRGPPHSGGMGSVPPTTAGMVDLLSLAAASMPLSTTPTTLPPQQVPLNQLNLALLQQSLALGSPTASSASSLLPSPMGNAGLQGTQQQLTSQHLRSNNSLMRAQPSLAPASFRPGVGLSSGGNGGAGSLLQAGLLSPSHDALLPTSPSTMASPIAASARARSPRELSSAAPEQGSFRHQALQEIGTSLARTGISVQQAVQAGLLGGMCAAEVKILCEAHDQVWKQTHGAPGHQPDAGTEWQQDPHSSSSGSDSTLSGPMLDVLNAQAGTCKQDRLGEFSLFGGQGFPGLAQPTERVGVQLGGYLDLGRV